MAKTGSPWWTPHRHADRRPALTSRGLIKKAFRAHFEAGGFTEVECGALAVSPGNEAHLAGFATEEVAPDVREFILRSSRPRQEVVLGYWQPLFERTPSELDAWIVREVTAVRESGVPFVSVLGRDPSPEDLAWLRTNLPEARTLVWPQSGHFPHLAHPRRFAELLAETGAWAGQAVTPVASR